jgi:uncharacterized protein with FMN-binding domain
LEITIEDQVITNIYVYDCGCTEEDKKGLYLIEANSLIDKILLENSTDIDITAGATHTSEGILEAVEKAILQAIQNE